MKYLIETITDLIRKPHTHLLVFSVLMMCTINSNISFGQLTQANRYVPSITWTRSFTAGCIDPNGNFLGGTELRSLVVFDGKLFAANGYWMDSLWYRRDVPHPNPELPGPQVFVLKGSGDTWKQDLVLNEKFSPETESLPDSARYVNFRRHLAISVMDAVTFRNYPDASGNPIDLDPPVPLLLVNTWDGYDAIQVWVRKIGDEPNWDTSTIEWRWPPKFSTGYHIRSFGFHRDDITGIDMVFAGLGHGKGIWSGVYDPTRPGSIRWGNSQDRWDDASCFNCTVHHPYGDWFDDDGQNGGIGNDISMERPGDGDRVMSFYEANGKLYATACGKLYERQDGNDPYWKQMYKHRREQCDTSPGEYTFRGAVAVYDTIGENEDILVAFEGGNQIGRIDLIPATDSIRAFVDLQVDTFLERKWGHNVGYIIVAYNHIVPFTLPYYRPEVDIFLMGFEAKVPPQYGYWHGWKPGFLIRFEDGSYQVHEVIDNDIPNRQLVGVRTMVISPFAEDSGHVIYAGGFDANKQKCRNTAWIYRGNILPSYHGPTGYGDNNSQNPKKGTDYNAGTSTLKIYDISGRLVKSLPSANIIPRMDFGLASGVYFLKIESDDHTEIKKLILVR
jgi:hypothetical protein